MTDPVEPDTAALRLDALRLDRLQRERRRRRVRRLVAVGVLAVSAVVCGGLIAVGQVKAAADSAAAVQESRDFTAPPLPTPTLIPTTDQIVVIGDEWASPRNTVQNRPWPLLLQRSTGVRVRALASNGGAYLADSVGAGGAPFSAGAGAVPPTATLIVFFGGARDASDDEVALAASATQTIADAARRAPGAQLVVVGPVPTRPNATAALRPVRDVLETVAKTARATWIDPVDEQWFNQSRYWDGADAAPSVAGNQRLATRMEAALRPFLRTDGATPSS